MFYVYQCVSSDGDFFQVSQDLEDLPKFVSSWQLFLIFNVEKNDKYRPRFQIVWLLSVVKSRFDTTYSVFVCAVC